MTAADPIVIVSTARTPMGGFQGDFASVPAAHLGSAAIKLRLRAQASPSRMLKKSPLATCSALAKVRPPRVKPRLVRVCRCLPHALH